MLAVADLARAPFDPVHSVGGQDKGMRPSILPTPAGAENRPHHTTGALATMSSPAMG
jgi:hypothetical protein